MSLNARQTAAYQNRISIVGVTPGIVELNGEVDAQTYYISARNVPCYFQFTDNINDPIEGAGREKRPSVFTDDTCHMEANNTITDQWIIRDETILPNGHRSPLYGTYSMVLGAPRIIANAGRRKANKLSVKLLSIEKPPAAVVALFA